MRTRNTNDSWMPPFVYLHKRAGVAESYVLKRHNSTKVLCKSSASKAEVWQAYESEIAEMSTIYTVNRLVIDYLNSTSYSELAPRTQKDRDIELKRFSNVFGEMKPDDIRAPDIRQYMDLRGQASKTQANHELAAASVMFGWGFERGKCNSNPAKGIKKFKLKTRDRYITDTEYSAVLACAEPRLKIAMEISYLCAARKGDVLNLTWSQLSDDGIYIEQGKTGKKQIKAWSKRLRVLIQEAELLQNDAASAYVINKKNGGKLSSDGLSSAWNRAKKRVKKKHPEIELSFTFHDIKAKGSPTLKEPQLKSSNSQVIRHRASWAYMIAR